MNFIRPDHGVQNRRHTYLWLGAIGEAPPRGSGQDCPKVIGRMSPLLRQPGIVKLKPADHRTNLKSRFDWP